MIKKESNNVARLRRHARVRSKVSGTAEMPRLNVFRSNNNIFVQIIDDVKGNTLVSSSSVELKLNKLTKQDIINIAQKVFSSKPIYAIVASKDTLDANKEFLDGLKNN